MGVRRGWHWSDGGTEMGTCRSVRKSAKGEREIPDSCYSFGQRFVAQRDSKHLFNFFFFNCERKIVDIERYGVQRPQEARSSQCKTTDTTVRQAHFLAFLDGKSGLQTRGIQGYPTSF